MNENYDYWHDFFRDDHPKYTKSKFVKKVFVYIKLEWEIDVEQLSIELQERIIGLIRKRKKQKCNVPNIASEIVFKLIPI